jgi:hypothetical protein
LTGRSRTPRLLVFIFQRLWNTGRPVKPGDDSGACFIRQGDAKAGLDAIRDRIDF